MGSTGQEHTARMHGRSQCHGLSWVGLEKGVSGLNKHGSVKEGRPVPCRRIGQADMKTAEVGLSENLLSAPSSCALTSRSGRDKYKPQINTLRPLSHCLCLAHKQTTDATEQQVGSI